MTIQQKPKSAFDLLSDGKTPETETSIPAPAPVLLAEGKAASIASQTILSNLGNADLLAQLVGIMLLKEQRELLKIQQEDDNRKTRDKQRSKNVGHDDAKILLKQARCRHLKGGKKGPKTSNKDYAVYQHTYIGADTVIRCQICGMRWRQYDKPEYLVRNDKKIANHTKLGWQDALLMVDQSTNTPSSTEIPWGTLGGKQNQFDMTGLAVNPQIRDLEGNLVESVQV